LLQHQILTRGRVPSFPFLFVPDTELAKTGNQDIVTGCQVGFDDFKKDSVISTD
jgi:hypothetical protein